MNSRYLVLVCCCLTVVIKTAYAQETFNEAKFLSDIGHAVEQSPTVLVAKANIERAKATANKMLAGPYQTEIIVGAGQRETNKLVGDHQDFEEWSGGLSRTIRLPNKRRLDKDLAELEVQIAEVEYRQYLIDEQLQFIDLWSVWAKNEILYQLSADLAKNTEEIAVLEQKKLETGAGRQMYVNQFGSEAKIATLTSEKLSLDVAISRSALVTRYPHYRIDETAKLPFITSREGSTELLEESEIPTVTLAKLKVEQASLLALKARSYGLPDPTVGINYTDEFDGQESSVMATLRIPFGRKSVRANTEELEHNLEMVEMSAQLMEQTALQRYELIERSAQVSSDLLENLEIANRLTEESLNQIQQGYAMGAVTISDLLLARRTYRESKSLVSEQRVDAISNLLKSLVINTEID